MPALQVEQPLCEACCQGVEEGIRKDMEAVREEAQAYEAALESLEGEGPPPASSADLALARQQEQAQR